MHRYATRRQGAPAQVPRKRREERMSASPEQRDMPGIGPLHVFCQSAQMNLPEFQFLLREVGRINDLFQVHRLGLPRWPAPIAPACARRCGVFAR